MDFGYSAEEEAFRHEVRGLARRATSSVSSPTLGTGAEFSADDWTVRVAWEQELGARRLDRAVVATAHGGREATAIEELVFAEEYARAGGPTRAGTFGEGLLGPTLIHFGTEEQRARFLPPILRGEEFWCQGFSEPGAGSDLAAARRPRPASTATSGSSTGRRSGRARRSSPTGSSCSAAPTPARRSTGGSRSSWCPWTNPASRCARSSR